MESNGLNRHLAAVLYADVAGYSRLTGDDEEGTHRRLAAGLDRITESVDRHGGRVVHFAGDAVLAEFSSALHALACAADAQTALARDNRGLTPQQRLEFRIGLNLGDVIADRDDIYGEGVNIAARLESLAEPGGICVSEAFRNAVGNKLPYDYRFLGERSVKNIATPVRAYHVLLDGEPGTRGLPATATGPRARRAAWLAGGLAVTVLAAAIAWPWLARLLGEEHATATPPVAMTRQLAQLPSIVVLPFRNLSADPAQAYFSDGLADDISTELSRFPELLVIAGSAAAAFRDRPADSTRIGRELGARYLLEGSAERGIDTVRINVQLVDAGSGVRLWAERFERDLASLSQTRDEIVQRVVSALAVRIEREETERARRKPGEDLLAYDYVLRGRERLARGTREDNAEAKRLLRQALSVDPESVAALLALGEAHRQAFRYGWIEAPEPVLAEMEAMARDALRLDDTNAGGHQLLGYVYQARQRLALAENEYLRALALNPNDAESYAGYGLTLLYLGGRVREAVAALETARRLDPHTAPSDSVRSRAWILALGYYLQGRPEDAIALLERHLEWFPQHFGMHALLAAAYAQVGRAADAERAAATVRRLDPFFSTDRFGAGLQDEDERRMLHDGLRKAGLT